MAKTLPTARYYNLTFKEVFPDLETFQEEVETFLASIPTGKGLLTDSDNPYITLTFYLLKGKYWRAPIATQTASQFKNKLFITIWQYGPVWAKKLELQDKLLALSDDELREGAKTIFNHAYNPSTEPSTDTLEELTYIDDQNATRSKKSKIDSYIALWSALSTNLSEEYVRKFAPCFQKFVGTQLRPQFDDEEEKEDNLDESYIAYYDDDGVVVVSASYDEESYNYLGWSV